MKKPDLIFIRLLSGIISGDGLMTLNLEMKNETNRGTPLFRDMVHVDGLLMFKTGSAVDYASNICPSHRGHRKR